MSRGSDVKRRILAPMVLEATRHPHEYVIAHRIEQASGPSLAVNSPQEEPS
jgi:hypothetical protein